MWGTMERIVDGLDESPPRRDLDVLVDALGPLRMVHLGRDDVVGQAVSWARAEQTGYWQEGDRSAALARFDFGQVADLVRTIREHNAAWSTWFAEQAAQAGRCGQRRLDPALPRSTTAELGRGRRGRPQVVTSSDGCHSCCRARAWPFVVGCGPRESQVRAVSRADTFGGCPGSWSVVPRRI
jgi:hypothetical protein